MERVLRQLDRLRRHYDSAVKTYDEVSLLDLSHALRIWTELKEDLKTISPKFSAQKVFKSTTPGRKLSKTVIGHEHVFAYMPEGVISYASNGDIVSTPQQKIGDEIYISTRVGDYYTHIKMENFLFVKGMRDSLIKGATKSEKSTQSTFENWMATEAVRGAFFNKEGDLKKFNISREIIIKRVANTLDGSHHSNFSEGTGYNKFDAPVHYLLDHKTGGLPLPYFILLKIAQDILKVWDKVFEKQ